MLPAKNKKVKGISAFVGGRVIGKVRIVFDPSSSQIKIGDVLVTRMTTPGFISLMKNAAAIVTDEESVSLPRRHYCSRAEKTVYCRHGNCDEDF